MTRRWVLTAAGAITAAGDDVEPIFAALLRGRPLEPTSSTGGFPATRIHDFDPRRYIQRKRLGLLSRTSQLACSAASRVSASLQDLPGKDVGIVFGSAWSSLDSIVRFEREAYTEGPRLVDPILFTETVANVPAGHASIFFGWSALNATVSAGTASGLEALRQAVRFLEEGRAEAVVAGGGDELNEHLLRTLHAEGATSAAGPIGGEGACLLVVEDERHAAGRGRPVLGTWLAGAGTCLSPRAPRADVVRDLLKRAGLTPEAVDLVVLSLNGSAGRDAAEAAAVGEVFGAPGPAIVVPKAVLGETWGAAGPLGVAVALECMRRSVVPGCRAGVPTPAGFEPLNVSTEPRERPVSRAVILDCSASGMVSAIAVAAPESAR